MTDLTVIEWAIIIGTAVIILISVIVFISSWILSAPVSESGEPEKAREFRYQKSAFLTPNEKAFLINLYKTSLQQDYLIFVNVDASKLVEASKTMVYNDRPAADRKAKEQCAGFVLCDKADMQPILVIEYDDKRSVKKNRQEAERFLKNAYGTAGLPVFYAQDNDDDMEAKIRGEIQRYAPKKTS